MQSPTYVKTSLASAIALRFTSGRFFRNARPYCINLLLSYQEDCKASCAYCGLARTRLTGEDSFIRVEWPTFETMETIRRIVRYKESIRRVCISTVFHPRAVEDTFLISNEIVGATRRVAPTESSAIPLSVLITPVIFGKTEMERLKAIGVDTVGIGLDAASRRVFRRIRAEGVKGPLSWEVYLTTLKDASEVFGPGKVSCHIIVGIGETDKELSEIFFQVKALKAMIHLFSFYPEPHSLMARRRRPSLRRFRRMQLLCYLVEKDALIPESLEFDHKERLTALHAEEYALLQAINSGRPFLTGGCPDRQGNIACNRPFGSYRPGEPFRDFPFQPTEQDIRRLKKELLLKEILTPRIKLL
ncbi:MAG TPA: radical SAM protein [Candidatus Hypogeohydataceae bacterium YC41]